MLERARQRISHFDLASIVVACVQTTVPHHFARVSQGDADLKPIG